MTAPRDWERELAEANAKIAELEKRESSILGRCMNAAQDLVDVERVKLGHARRDRDAALSRVAELTAEVSRLELLGECCVPLARLAELQAQASEAQATLRKVLDWVDQTRPMCGAGCRAVMPEALWTRISKALSTDAGRALAERVAVLEEVVEAARQAAPGRCYCLHADENHARSTCPRCEEVRAALARLDSLPRGGGR